MPAAKFTLDFDTRKFFDINGSLITALTGKKGSIREYELSISQGGVPMNLPTGTTVSAALKKTTDPAGLLLTESDATRVGWGSGSRWSFRLDLTDVVFDAILGTKVDFEVRMILPDGQIIPSLTVPFTIEKNVLV